MRKMAPNGESVVKARVLHKGFCSLERPVFWQKLKRVQEGSDFDRQQEWRQKTPGPAPTAIISATEEREAPPTPSLELTLAFITLGLLWAIALFWLRKRSWWFLPI